MSAHHADRCVGQRNVREGRVTPALFSPPVHFVFRSIPCLVHDSKKASGSRVEAQKHSSQLIDESIFYERVSESLKATFIEVPF